VPIPQENDPSATSPPKIDATTPCHTGKEQWPGATSPTATWQPDEQRTMSFVVVDYWVSSYLSPPTTFTLQNPGATTGYNAHRHEQPLPSTLVASHPHYNTPQHRRNATSPRERALATSTQWNTRCQIAVSDMATK
jgi:hypothetical protein